MSFDQAICWVFGCCESDLQELYWRYTNADFRGRLKLKIGEFTVSHLQQAHGLIRVAAMVFGGGKPKEHIIGSVEEMNRMMAGG